MFDTPTMKAVDNVVSFKNANDVKAKAPNQDLFFPVELVPLKSLTGVPDVGLNAVIRTDTQQILHVPKKRYTLVKNQAVFDVVDRAIARCRDLSTNAMKVVDQISYDGGRSIRSYVFPEHKIDVGGGDETILRINVINSYDGSTNLRVCAGGYRIVCKNGMVIGNDIGDYTSRHTGVICGNEIGNRIGSCLQNFLEVGAQWKHWAKEECTDAKAVAVITEFANGSEKLAASLTDYWIAEKVKMGNTMWALFNALTYWSTHHDVQQSSRKNLASIVTERERRVGKIISSPVFKAVA